MKACNCTVMLTNPNCWKTCPNMRDEFIENNGYTQTPWINPTTTNPYESIGRKRIKTIKTIEKFGSDGKLIGKEIITEEEVFDDITFPSSTTGDIPFPTPSNIS
jgi:hypothetical protein